MSEGKERALRFFFSFRASLSSLTSGCVSCVGCPTSSSNAGSDANEREGEEKKGFCGRTEEEQEQVEVNVADAERAALAAAIDADDESFAAEAAAVAHRRAKSTGREILPAGAIASKSQSRRMNREASSFAPMLCFPLRPFVRRESGGKVGKKNLGQNTSYSSFPPFLLSFSFSLSLSSPTPSSSAPSFERRR